MQINKVDSVPFSACNVKYHIIVKEDVLLFF